MVIEQTRLHLRVKIPVAAPFRVRHPRPDVRGGYGAGFPRVPRRRDSRKAERGNDKGLDID